MSSSCLSQRSNPWLRAICFVHTSGWGSQLSAHQRYLTGFSGGLEGPPIFDCWIYQAIMAMSESMRKPCFFLPLLSGSVFLAVYKYMKKVAFMLFFNSKAFPVSLCNVTEDLWKVQKPLFFRHHTADTAYQTHPIPSHPPDAQMPISIFSIKSALFLSHEQPCALATTNSSLGGNQNLTFDAKRTAFAGKVLRPRPTPFLCLHHPQQILVMHGWPSGIP